MMSIREEILDVLKQTLLPELAEAKQRDEQLLRHLLQLEAESRERDQQLLQMIVQLQAEVKVIIGRLDRMDERFEQVERSLRELREDVREVRSYVFVSKVSGTKDYQVREDK